MNKTGPDRRKFFSALTVEFISFVREMKGIPQLKLDSLNELPDEVIETMIPVLFQDSPYRIGPDRLLIFNRKSGMYEDFRLLSKHEMFILKSFDGNSTIKDITGVYAGKYKMDGGEAYQQVKSLFLEWAKHMVCHPKDAHL